MSEILERIRNEKVEWKRLGEVCEINKFKQISAEILENLNMGFGEIYLLPSSKNYNWKTTREKAKDLICKGKVITLGRARYSNIKYCDGEFISSNNIIIASRDENFLVSKFLYYFISLNHEKFYVETGSYPKFTSDIFKNFEIPIPSLETQEKIVKILDKFQKYASELQHELQLRIKQYEYYRDLALSEVWLKKQIELLNKYIKGEITLEETQYEHYRNLIFNELLKLEEKTIGEVYTRLRGTSITAVKMKEIENEKGEIKIFAGGKTVVNAFEKDIENANIIREPAVLVQSRGNIDVIYYDKPFTFKNEMWAYTNKEKESVKYLYYYLQANIKKFRDKASSTGAFPQISIDDTEKFKILLPPIVIQKRVVDVLDKFEEMINNTKGLLPHEIELRRKQYEYYREKLLTFEAKCARERERESSI